VTVVPVVPVVSEYHRVIHSYSSINGDKYCRNNCHCSYWHHWHHRHIYSDHWNNGKYPVVPEVPVTVD
jgi:adenine-specific DNA methylase